MSCAGETILYSSLDAYKDRLVLVQSSVDIPARWAGTPIEKFIQAQNMGYPLIPSPEPQLLISTCIEFRYALPVPSKYAYVVRTAGGRLVGSEFAIGYVMTRGVKNILLIAHNDCGMTKLAKHSHDIMQAFIEQGWSHKQAEDYVKSMAPRYAIGDELDALEQEYHRLKKLFKAVHVAPLFLDLSDLKVHIPKWYLEFISSPDAQQRIPISDADILALR